MFCFAKVCCLCLSKGNQLTSVQTKSKDDVKLLDKITYCFQEDIIKQILPNAFICRLCKNQILRTYRFMVNVRMKFDLLKSYVTELSGNGNYTQKTGNLQICVHRNRILDQNVLESNASYLENKLEPCKSMQISVERKRILDQNELEPNKSYLTRRIEDKLQPRLDPCVQDDAVKVKIEYNLDGFDDIINLIEDYKIKSEVDTESKEMEYDYDYKTYDLICKEENLENCFCNEDIKVLLDSCSDDGYMTSSNNSIDKEKNKENIEETIEEKKFNSKENMCTHEEKRKKLDPFKCPFCDNTFYTNYSIFRHISKHTEKRFNCKKCVRTFTREITLKQHNMQHVKNGNV